MYFMFFGQGPVSEEEFIALRAKREEQQAQLEALQKGLEITEERFRFLSAIYAPKINVIEVNNQSMGHRYIGRFSVPGKEGKPERYTVSLSRAEEYPSKDDPQLAELARRKALELLMRKHPDLFIEKS